MNFMLSKTAFCKLLFVITFTTVLVSCNKQKVNISGELANVYDTMLYLSEFKLVNSRTIDSVKVNKNGKFKFSIKSIKDPGFYQLSISPSNFILLLVKPGESIKVSASAKNMNYNYVVTGSEGSKDVKILTDKLNSTKSSLDSLSKIADQSEGQAGYKQLLVKLDSQYVEIIKEQRKFSIKYIIEHLSSFSSIVAIYQQIDDNNYVLNQNRDIQYVKILSDTLQKYYPENDIVKILNNDKDRLLIEFNKLKLATLAKNATIANYPDLAMFSNTGDTIKLKNIKAKLILVNFWDPDNEESLIVVRGLKEVYAKYHKKGLEIYNIGVMNDVKKWIYITKKYEFPGIQVIETNIQNPYSAKIYNVSEIPSNILLNSEGIQSKNIFGETLENTVAHFLQ